MFKISPRNTKICHVCGQNKLNESEYAFLNGSTAFSNGNFKPLKKATKVSYINTKPSYSRMNKKVVSLF